MINRWIEKGLLATLEELGAGCIAFSPLAQGLLTSKYLKGVPQESRAKREDSSLLKEFLSEENLKHVRALNDIAQAAARPSRKWPSPGCCATRVSLRLSSAHATSSSLTTHSMRSRTSNSLPPN